MSISDDHEILRRFNAKVTRLEATRMYQRYVDSIPEVIAVVRDVEFSDIKNGQGEFTAHFRSWLKDFDQDDIDAFVLSYRILTQNNDRLSIGSLAKIYEHAWMPQDALDNFREARSQLNDYFDNSYTTVTIDSPISIRELLDVIIYGALAHSKPSKETTFNQWTANGGFTGLFWGEFISALKEVMTYLVFFKELNAAVLANTDVNS